MSYVSVGGPKKTPDPLPYRGGNLVEYERYIDEQIRKTRSFVKSVDVAFGMLVLVVAVLGFVSAAVLLDHWLVPGGLGFVGRLFCFAILVGGTVFLFARWVAPLVFRSINPLYAANAIEQSRSSFKNSLLNLLLFRQDRAAVPDAVYRSVERQAATVLAEAPIETAVDRSGLIQWGYVLAALVAALGLYKLFSPKDPLVTIERIIAPWADVAAPTRVAIQDIRPGNGSYIAGRRVEVSAEIDGLEDEEPATLYFSTADGQIADRALRMSAASGYRYRVQVPPEGMDLRQDLTYRIEAGDARTPTYELAVEDAPTIVVKAIDYDYPAYTEGVLQDRRDERSGDIKGLEGTQVTIHVEANQDIAAAHIDFECDGTNDLPMTVKGREASRAFGLRFADRDNRVAEHARYQILFTTRGGRKNEQPVQHSIEVLADLPPEVEIVRPDKDEVLVPENGQQIISVKALDPDFKLDDVRLVMAVESGKSLPAQALLPDKDRPWQGWLAANYRFVPRQSGLKAGSVVTFHATARDNQSPQANASRTRDFRIRIVEPQPSQKRPKQEPTPADPEGKPDEKKEPNEKPRPQDNKDDKQQDKPGEKEEPKPGEKGKSQESKNPQKNGEKKEQSKPNGKDPADPKQSAEKDPSGGGKPDGKPQPGAEGGEGKTDEQRPGEKGKSGSPSDSKPAGGENKPGEGPADKPDDDASGGGQKSPGGSAGERKADDSEAIDELLNDRQKSNTEEGTSAKTKADGNSDPSAAKTDDAADQKSVKKESGEKGGSTTDDSTATDKTGEKRNEKADGQGESPPKEGQTDKGDGGGERPKTNLDNTEKTREPSDKPAETRKPGLGDPSRGNTGKPGSKKEAAPEAQEKRQPRRSNKREGETGGKPSEEEATSPSQGKTESNASKGEEQGDRPGGGKKGGGQKSDQAGQDTAGKHQSSPSGAGASKEEGEGATGSKPGDQDEAAGPTGKSGDEKGKGSKVKPGDSSTGKGQPAKGEKTPPDPKKSDKSKTDESGKSSEKGSDQKGDGRQGDGRGGEGPGGGNAQRDKDPPKPREIDPEEPPREDEPNLDHARNATDLALDHLRDRMQKGNEEEILKKLGWSREEADEFLRRWMDLKRKADQSGPDGADGRRQLEDALKSLGLRSGSTTAQTTAVEKDTARGLSSGPRVPPPPEYVDRAKAYKRGIGESRGQGSGVRGQ